MVKSIIKEIFIMLLLCVAIALILLILFYDYIPTNRVIPTKEAYVTQENVKAEIAEQITELEKTEISYEITDADLNLYKQTSSYKPGKSDPFSLAAETTVNENGGASSDANDNNKTEDETKKDTEEQTNTDTTSNVDKNSTGTFFNDEGIK